MPLSVRGGLDDFMGLVDNMTTAYTNLQWVMDTEIREARPFVPEREVEPDVAAEPAPPLAARFFIPDPSEETTYLQHATYKNLKAVVHRLWPGECVEVFYIDVHGTPFAGQEDRVHAWSLEAIGEPGEAGVEWWLEPTRDRFEREVEPESV